MDKDKRVKSAEIIQRNFRKYLQRREVQRNQVKANDQGDNSQIKNINCENVIIRSLNNPQASTNDISQQNGNLQRQNTIIIKTSAIKKDDTNNLNDTDTPKIEELRKEINEICAGLNKFYTNLPHTTENLKHQDDLLTDIDQVLQNLENISTLEDCARVKSEDITKETLLKHQQALNNLTFKWWQHLNEDN